MAAAWKMPLWYVTTFWKISLGTMSGRKLCRAGPLNARTTALTTSSA